jgi:hypothetical protein
MIVDCWLRSEKLKIVLIFGGRLKETLDPTMKRGFDMIDKISNF